MSATPTYAQEIEAIESILSKANVLLKEFEDRERNMQQHNANMQAFISVLEEMKNKLILMIQSYENDNLLSKLLELNDSIDDAVNRLSSDPSNIEELKEGESISAANVNDIIKRLYQSDDESSEEPARLFKTHTRGPSETETLWDDIALLVDTPGDELPNLSLIDGASSSGVKRKKEKGKSKKEDKKGKVSVKVTCKICCDEFDSWYLLHELTTCKHVYCIECLREYYTQRIKDGSALGIACPDPSCRSEVTPNDVKDVLDVAMWEKYDNFVLIASLKQDPKICWCPAPGCTNAIFREPTDDTKVTCDACRVQFCADCKEQWHDGMSCEEFAAIKEKIDKSAARQNPSFRVWTNKHSKMVKPCPGCKGLIEKVDGCNHMTCVNCKFQFCWMCLSEYTAMHFNDSVNHPDCYMRQYYTPRPWYKPHVEKHTLVKAGKIIGIGAAVVILGVPAAVIGGPIYGCYKLRQKLKPKRWVITNHGWEQR